jgi:DNA-binding MarR family transcriptional regulator
VQTFSGDVAEYSALNAAERLTYTGVSSPQPGAGAVDQWEVIVRAVSAARRCTLQGIEASGLPGQSFGALHVLLRSRDHQLPMSYLARHLAMTTGGFTKLADRLGQEGLIDRRSDSGDRRVVYARLTAKGVEVATSAVRDYETAVREHIVSALGESTLEAIAVAMTDLDRAMSTAAYAILDLPADRNPDLPERRQSRRRHATSA